METLLFLSLLGIIFIFLRELNDIHRDIGDAFKIRKHKLGSGK